MANYRRASIAFLASSAACLTIGLHQESIEHSVLEREKHFTLVRRTNPPNFRPCGDKLRLLRLP
ncbi:MAG: hypothetical protein CMM01_24595 [Rhodopirellula sp.]|nr:hypothetical protein [Rhodopirellula sp.]